MSMFLQSTLVLVSFLLNACGSYVETHEKDYRLFFDTKNEKLLEESRRLVSDFNHEIGFKALEFVDHIEESNSTVTFNKGLAARTRKLGYGQWVTRTYSEAEIKKYQGQDVHSSVKFGMELEFDKEFFLNRAGLSEEDHEYQRLRVLFHHEVGHGLQFDHVEDKSDIMYETIQQSADYDFDRFYESVNQFFQ